MKSVGAKLTVTMVLWMIAGGAGWCGEDKASGGSSANGPVMLFPVEVSGKWGYMDNAGNVMIAPQYECAWDFSEGLACIQVGVIRGYIDQTGAMAIKPQFAWAGKFSGGRASVNGTVAFWGDFLNFYQQWFGPGWCYIDSKGNTLPGVVQGRRQPDWRDRFATGPAPTKKGDLWGFYDRAGLCVVEPQYEEAYEFGEGLAPVAVLAENQKPPEKRDWQWQQRRKLTWGFIDQTGKMAINPRFEDAWPFSCGLASVRISGSSTNAGQSKWGYVNKAGEEVVKAQYDYSWPLSEGRGRVLLSGKHGYIDDKGQEVIKPQFDGAWEFSKGLARVIVGENEWYLNPKGEYVWNEAKRKVHQQLLALRLEAAWDKRKEATAKYRVYMKEQASNPYARGAALAHVGEIVGVEAVDELCSAVEGSDLVMREIAMRALTALSGEGVTQKLIARSGTVRDSSLATYIGVLGRRGDKASISVVRENLKDQNDEVRLASLTAVTMLAGTNAVKDLSEALKTGTFAAREVACGELGELPNKEALSALAGALAEAPAALRARILRILAERKAQEYAGVALAEAGHADPGVRMAAFEALGVLGGEKELVAVIGAIPKAKDDKERGAAEKAVGGIVSRGIKNAETCATTAVDALPTVEPATWAALIRVLGRVGGGKAFVAVEAATKDQDAEKRDTAVKTLLAWPDGAATEAVLALARTLSDDALRESARRNFIRLLGLPGKREPAQTLELCVTGLAMAKQAEEKKQVIACFGRIRLMEAMKALAPILNDDTMRNDAATAMVNAGAALSGANPNEVKAYMQQVAAAAVDKNSQQSARNVAAEIEKYEGYITAWTVAGPYVKDGAEVKTLLDEVFSPENQDAKDVEWKPLAANARNWNLDLTKVFNRDNCVAYLRVALESSAAQDAVLELGSNAGIKVWLNGEVVHANNAVRVVKPGDDKVKAGFKEGSNILLFKVNHGRGGGWGVCARLKKPTGEILSLKGME